MDKNAIKKYAIWARRELISRVSQKAAQYAIIDGDIADANAETINGIVLTNVEKTQRRNLIVKIKEKGYEQVMEEVAYTWFNRFCALRFMEVNNYLPSHVRVFTNEENEFRPQIIDEAIHLELEGLNMQKVYAYKEANDNEGLYKYLIITQNLFSMKKFTMFFSALLFSMMSFAGVVTFDADVDKGNAGTDSNNAAAYTITKDGVTVEVSSGILGTYNNEMHYRIYKNQTLKITSTAGNITSVQFTCTANDAEKYGPGCFTVDGGDYTYAGPVGTWTGSADAIVFTASSNQVRATQVVVTLETTPTGVEDVVTVEVPVKVIENGQLMIIRGENVYNVLGAQVK